MRRAARLALALGLWLALAAPAAPAPNPFANWAAVVVAGDWRGHEGGATEAFDNARRDVGRALLSAGFQPQNLREFSVRPQRYKPRPARSDIDRVYDVLSSLTARADGGCLIYVTSHGDPEGVVVDEELMAPSVLDAMLSETCGGRPTIVILSACYSGVFVPELSGPNRMVLTAARADRSSFGCGESDRYPYFDDCFLQSFRGSADFRGLAEAVRTCVARREHETGMTPPSEPQLSIGPMLSPQLSAYPLPGGRIEAPQF